MRTLEQAQASVAALRAEYEMLGGDAYYNKLKSISSKHPVAPTPVFAAVTVEEVEDISTEAAIEDLKEIKKRKKK